MSVKHILIISVILVFAVVMAGASETPRLFQQPTLSRTSIVFAYGGDLWTVPRDGGAAERLTSSTGVEKNPFFSPDGKLIAFTGQYDGNTDVFLVPASGGVPLRLTSHPGADEVVGWSPDGKRIIFRSTRKNQFGVSELFTVGPEGGQPEALPMPTGRQVSFSPSGDRMAYVPKTQWQAAWKRYMGGQTLPIWIVDAATLKVEKVPRENSNDTDPMWIGDKIYFLSDRTGPITLFVYDTGARTVTRVLENTGLDIKSASAGPGAIVYEQFGSINLFDTATGKTHPAAITIEGDFPEVRPHYVKVGGRIAEAAISPTGARAVFEARGEILTVPAEKGDIRNLTNTPDVMERDPAWSPDGKSIAYFSDASGEYVLHIIDQAGKGPVRKISLSDSPSFFYRPVWSPDGKKIAFNDKHLNLWYVDLAGGKPVKVDTTYYFNPGFAWNFSWSADSRWLTYNKQLKNHLCVIMAYSLETGAPVRITDGMSDARFPAFDKSGKYLFFTASTDVGLTPGWLNMTSMDRPITRSVYVCVLGKDLPSPLAPESDEEKVPEKGPADKPATADKGKKDKPAAGAADEAKTGETPARTVIDIEGISQRILALPIPSRNYVALAAGKEGTIYLQETPVVQVSSANYGGATRSLSRFDLASRKFEKFLDNVSSFVVSGDGSKVLYWQGGQFVIVPAAGPVEPGKGVLRTAEMEVYVDPRAEWKQMYHEAWRIERDFFYDPGLHGLDLKTIEARYAPYVDGLISRGDLNYLFEEMLGELTCGHVFVGGGDLPRPEVVPVGLLGADYEIDNGRYRFARVYDGENWNPAARAPLTQPGINVKPGEYLLAVNGRDVRAPREIYSYFEATAGKQTVLKVGPRPDGSGSRDVTVVPVRSDTGLRRLAWIEDNRRKVDKLSGGRLAYVHLPDTAEGGFTSFNRFYFAQVGKEGAIIDERFNGGGLIADYIIDYMKRPLQGYFAARDGADYQTPVGSIYGPKVMLINEYAGSGGDMMPWLFRDAKIGHLVGTRTWGGLVGMAGAASLMDGGQVGAPQSGFWNPNGTWDVENHGVDPDIMVEQDPAAVRSGGDPQLEKAVKVCLELLEKNPLPKHTKPAYPDYQHKR